MDVPSQDEIGKRFFEYSNRGWPNPTWTWENLSENAKKLWIERALTQLKGKSGKDVLYE